VNVHHIALLVADCERAARFYTDVLGLAETRRQVDDGGLRSVWLAAGDVVIMLERAMRGRPGASGSGHLLCFGVDDLASWESRLRDHGVAVEDRTPSTLYLSDPDGHRVGLSVFEF
jgi:glyoxylase I family protein